jgi:hypothetical protein
MGDLESETGPENTVLDRVTGGRVTLWFLVKGNRLVVAGTLILLSYGVLVLLATYGPGATARKLLDPEAIFALFTPMVIAIVIGTSLILTFNQLVLSRELGPLAEQREHMAGALEFREDVESATDTTTAPPEPSAFLRALVVATGRQAETLADLAEDVDDEEVRRGCAEYARTVVEDAAYVSGDLEDEQFGRFEVVEAALNYDYSRKTFDGRQLRNRHGESLPGDVLDALDDLLDTLEFFGPAREHFKTLYFRWDIVNVSRMLVYTALPSLLVAAYMILTFQTSIVPGNTLGFDNGLLIASAAFMICAAPFVLFLTYILRIVSVAKWTLAIGPFILRVSDRETDVE